ncbi:MAG: single stranded DNA-binding domain-containing protein [Streptosporangiaceae bacterium]
MTDVLIQGRALAGSGGRGSAGPVPSGPFPPGQAAGGQRGRRRRWSAPATSIAGARPQRRLSVTGVIRAAETVLVAGSPSWRCVLDDGTGRIDLLFLGRAAMPDLRPGRRCDIEGTVARRNGALVVWNARYRLRARDEPACR